jgi:hypothetical protein
MTTQKLEEPEWILPFESMRVGDSFFIPTLRPADMTYIIDTRSKVAEVRVKIYPAIKDNCLGLRVWRVR